MVMIRRNPLALIAVTFMAVFQALIYGSLFWKVASQNFSYENFNHNVQITNNFIGLAFMVSSD